MDQTITKTEVPASREKPAPTPTRVKRRRTSGLLRPRYFAVAGVVLLALAYGGHELYMRLTHVYEYDARITADMITMSSRVDGFVIDLPVEEGTRLKAGETLARIDDRISKLRADGLRAQILAVQADRGRLEAERRMIAGQSDARVRTRSSGIAVSDAARGAMEADLLLANQDLERARTLFERGVITDKQLQTAQAAVSKLLSVRRQLEAERSQAESNLDEARAETEKLGVIDGQIAGLAHLQSNLEAQLEQQLVDVEDRTVKTPVPAVIDRLFVKPGEYVNAGQRILMLHDPDALWIEANIKETQVRKLKIGQPVKISVDAFPDDEFIGKVVRIGSATTNRFALLPTPNPSGNFTKITQRVAVKIQIVQSPRPLSPGMMVEVDIDIR